MAYNEDTGITDSPITDIASWAAQYKEQRIEMHHDDSMFDLVSPDDSILVAGPARLSEAYRSVNNAAGTGAGTPLYVIGVCQNFSFTETAQIQPFKAIGSRRHLFTKTNTPVSAQIARMMFYGKNLALALYSSSDIVPFSDEDDNNEKCYVGGATKASASFLTNIEEDMFRTPFGLGIIYHSTKTAHRANVHAGIAVAAEYLECCYLQSRSSSIQSGQTIVMEQVSIVADRVVPWDAYQQTDL